MTSSSALVRAAGAADLEAVRLLVAGMGGHDEVLRSGSFAAVYTEMLGSPVCAAFVATAGGTVVGYAEVHRRPSTLHACVEGWLAGLAVDEASRGTGVGRSLLARAEDAARRLGCTELVLESSVSRTAARAFYLGLGFTDQVQAHRYRKPLTGAAGG